MPGIRMEPKGLYCRRLGAAEAPCGVGSAPTFRAWLIGDAVQPEPLALPDKGRVGEWMGQCELKERFPAGYLHYGMSSGPDPWP